MNWKLTYRIGLPQMGIPYTEINETYYSIEEMYDRITEILMKEAVITQTFTITKMH